jgi:hypothetical protein
VEEEAVEEEAVEEAGRSYLTLQTIAACGSAMEGKDEFELPSADAVQI